MPLTGGMGQEGKRGMTLKGMVGFRGTRFLLTGSNLQFLGLDYDLFKMPRPNVSRTPLFGLDPTTPCSLY